MSIVLNEKYNRNNLKIIIGNLDALYPKISSNWNFKSQQGITDLCTLKTNLVNMLNRSSDSIKYSFSKGQKSGRLFAKNSLQGISRSIRHTISKDLYWDIDMVNSAPSTLENYCEKNNINSVFLKDYVVNRKERLDNMSTSLNFTYNKCKQIILKIINNGSIKKYIDDIKLHNSCSWILSLNDELVTIRDSIIKLNPKIVKSAKAKIKKSNKDWENLEGTVINKLLCDIENNILCCMYEYCDKNNIEVGVLIFDGLMIYKKNDETCFDVSILKSLENEVLTKLNIPIKLLVKHMDEDLDLTGLTISDIDINDLTNIEGISDEINILISDCLKGSHAAVADLFKKIYGDDFIVIKNVKDGSFYHWNQITLLWDEEPIQPFIRLLSEQIKPLIKRQVDHISDLLENNAVYDKADVKMLTEKIKEYSKLLSYLGTTPFLINICKYYHSYPTLGSKFEISMNNSIEMLPLLNGSIIDLRTKEVRMRNKSDLFSFELDVSYCPSDSYPETEKFFNDISCGDKDLVNYHQRLWGYALTGHITDRSLHIPWGDGSNGKSTLMVILQLILKKFYCTLSESVLLKSDKKSSAGSATPELMCLMFARLAVLEETGQQETLNSKRVKSITGGDTITGRHLFGHQVEFNTQSKPIMPTNFKPIFNIDDPAMIARIKLIPFLAKFDIKNQDNLSFIQYLKTPIILSQFFSWLVEGAFLWLNGNILIPCDAMNNEMEKYIDEIDTLGEFLSENYDKIDKVFYNSLKPDMKKNNRIKRDSIYGHYVSECILSKEKCIGKKDFYKRIRDKYFFEIKMKDAIYYLAKTKINISPDIQEDKEFDDNDGCLTLSSNI
jgi:P4 family phage/plasmid primase-like protien